MIFILLHYLLSFVTVTSSAHQRFLCCVISSSAAISVPHSVRVWRYYGPPGGCGGPSLGDRPPGGGRGLSDLGWGRTRGGRVPRFMLFRGHVGHLVILVLHNYVYFSTKKVRQHVASTEAGVEKCRTSLKEHSSSLLCSIPVQKALLEPPCCVLPILFAHGGHSSLNHMDLVNFEKHCSRRPDLLLPVGCMYTTEARQHPRKSNTKTICQCCFCTMSL